MVPGDAAAPAALAQFRAFGDAESCSTAFILSTVRPEKAIQRPLRGRGWQRTGAKTRTIVPAPAVISIPSVPTVGRDARSLKRRGRTMQSDGDEGSLKKGPRKPPDPELSP
jgi:hypothetical protein